MNQEVKEAEELSEKYMKKLKINEHEVFTVEMMYSFLEELMKDGKTDYILTCEGGCVGLGKPLIFEKHKEIEF